MWCWYPEWRLSIPTWNQSKQNPMSKDRYIPEIERVTNHEIDQSVSSSRFLREVRPGDKGQRMCDLNFKRMVYLLVLCTTIFSSSYSNVLPRIWVLWKRENFLGLPMESWRAWELLRELSMQEENLRVIKSTESHMKDVYYCFIIVLENIPYGGTEMTSVVSPRMLKWAHILHSRVWNMLRGCSIGTQADDYWVDTHSGQIASAGRIDRL